MSSLVVRTAIILASLVANACSFAATADVGQTHVDAARRDARLLDWAPLRASISHAYRGARPRPPFQGVVGIAVAGTLQFSYTAPGVTLQHRFVLASQSKQLTAVMLMRAVDEGLVTLDTPVAHFYPHRGALYQYPHGPMLTVRHLLEHSSGLVAMDKAPEFAAGSQFAYNNVNYDLLGEILAKLYQRPYAAVAQRLFDRCLMLHAVAPRASQPTSTLATLVVGYQETEQGSLQRANVDTTEAWLPSGRLVASGSDLLRFQQCVHQQSLLSASSYQLFTEARQQRVHRWGMLGYAMGLQVNQQDGLLEYSHSGYVNGYISTTLYYPRYQLGVVLLEPLSLQIDESDRPFYYHDQLRQALRQQLLAQGTP